jgi:hypothetical protein
MPNTLAHLCVQGLASRGLFPRSDLKWIALGCVIPDAPWILHRLITPLADDPFLLELRLVSLVQGSLLFCLLLAGAFSTLSREPGRIFRLLAFNSLLHLLLDACQTKWGNGVHLFAPLSWEMLNFGLFWPESVVTVVLSAGGLVWLVYAWWRSPGTAVPLSVRPAGNLLVGGGLLFIWLWLPVALIWGPERADNHSIATLRFPDQRAGKEVAFDRPTYLRDGESGTLRVFTRESFPIREGAPEASGTVSVRARFVDSETLDILEAHRHWPHVRDFSSILALGLIALLWVWRLFRERRLPGPGDPT